MVIIFLLSLFLLPTTTQLSGQGVTGENKTFMEHYRYQMRPAGSTKAKHKRLVAAKYVHTDNGTVFTLKIVGRKTIETLWFYTGKDGKYISGAKQQKKKNGKLGFDGTIWVEGNTAYTKKLTWHGFKEKKYRLPHDKELAVDASLLLILRHFPFNQQEEQDIYMIDFSQKSITITARQMGIETVTVPAGEFECYRIQVKVNLWVYNPKITYWLTTKKPHFLVKHRGMISPLSKTYITELTSLHGL